jgi:pimeloyl-ACP methyl ester carboxylesterase
MPHFTNDHRRLHFRERGEGPVLLVLTGNTSSSVHHESELEYFGRTYHAACLDFWGTGLSERAAEWPADWWDVAVTDTAALAERLSDLPVVLVGQSGGAMVALRLAIRRPDLVRAVIADSEVERFPAAWFYSAVAKRAHPGRRTVAFWQRAHGDDWEDVVRADTRLLDALAAQGEMDLYNGRLPEISCPVLLTASLADDVLPDVAAQVLGMARQMPGCHLYISPQGGHPLMWSRPQAFRTAATCFLQALEAGMLNEDATVRPHGPQGT